MKTNLSSKMEIVVTTPDKIGVLSRISTVITETRVNIIAICAYATDGIAHLRLITDDNKKAGEALNKAGFEATEYDVTVAEVSPHHIHPELSNLVGGVEIANNYWCASAYSGEHAMIIFSTGDNLPKQLRCE